jgi:hypothetical protein
MKAIQALPCEDRQLLYAIIDGKDHRQIAAKMGISYQASLSRLYRIRKRIANRVSSLLSGIICLSKKIVPTPATPPYQITPLISGGLKIMTGKLALKTGIVVVGVVTAGWLGWNTVFNQSPTTPQAETSITQHNQAASLDSVSRPLSTETKSPTVENQPITGKSAVKTKVDTEIKEFLDLLEAWESGQAIVEAASSEDEEVETDIEQIPPEEIQHFLDGWKIVNMAFEFDMLHDELVAQAKSLDTSPEERAELLTQAKRLEEVMEEHLQEAREAMAFSGIVQPGTNEMTSNGEARLEQFIRQIGPDNLPLPYPEILGPWGRELLDKIRSGQ